MSGLIVNALPRVHKGHLVLQSPYCTAYIPLGLLKKYWHLTSDINAVQENIDRIYSWFQRMRMPLSISKCLVIHYGVNNPHFQYDCGTSILPASDTFTDLSVRRSASGFFHDDIAMVAQKGCRLVEMCFRLLQSRQPDFLLKVYKTYILPFIMYASQLWSPNLRYEVNELEAVQRIGSPNELWGVVTKVMVTSFSIVTYSH